MKKILFLLFLFLIGLVAYGQNVNYYVSQSTGNDASADPTNPATPWKTLAKVNTIEFHYKDSIFFKRGDTWKEYLSPRGDAYADTASVGKHIVFTAYGTGHKPIFTARDTIEGYQTSGNWSRPWSVTRPNVWYNREVNRATAGVPRMWFDGVLQQVSYTTATAPDQIAFPPNASQKYYWYGDDSLFVYCTQNPALEYTGAGIEESQARRYCVYLVGDRYITLSYLALEYGYIGVASVNADPITIDSCEISSAYGATFSNNTTNSATVFNQDVIIKNCVFNTGSVTTGYTYNPLYTWDAIQINGGCKNFDIHDNWIQDYGHASLNLKNITEPLERIDNILFYDNYCTSPNQDYGGRLDVEYINGTGNKIYNNTFYSLSISSQINGENMEIYYNVFNTVKASLYNPNEAYGMIISGFQTVTKCHNYKIYNNVIANCVDEGLYITNSLSATRHAKHNISVINNIFYNNDYNLKVTDEDSVYNNTFKNNLFFKTGITDVIDYHGSAITVTEFNAENGDHRGSTILNNLSGNPLFTGAADFNLLTGSPAINTGIDVLLTSDIAGTFVPQGLYVDIGAYEFEDFPIATTGLGWEEVLSHRNFKGDVNIAGAFSVDGVPIIFAGGEPVNLPGLTASVSELNKLDGAIVTTTEINYLKNTTDTIQNQFTGKASTALSNLASVAINTHLLPGIDGAVNLGSATYKFGNIFIDTAKVINFNNGDVTITHSDQNLTFAGGNLVIPDITGPTNITKLSVGNSASATKVSLDSLGLVDSKIASYIAADTTDPYITAGGRQELTAVSYLLGDTLTGDEQVATWYDVSLKANLASPTLTGTPAAPTAAAGTNTTQIATTAFVQATSTNFDRLEFIVDTTARGPITGDSVVAYSFLIDKHVEIDRGTNGGTLYRQYRKNVGQKYHNGYSFQKSQGKIVFTPKFATNGHVIITATDSTSWTKQSMPFYAEYQTIYDLLDTKPTGDTCWWQNDLVYSLDSAGLWDRVKLLYMPVAASLIADSYHNWAAVNNTSDYTAVVIDAPAFDRVVGWDGNGSSDVLTSGWIPGSDSSLVNHAAGIGNNDLTIAAWCTASTKGNTNPMGVTDVAYVAVSFINYSGSNTFYAYLNAANPSGFGANVTGSGFSMATRRGPTDVEGYRNGAPTGTVDTDESVRLPINRALYLLAMNNDGTAAAFHPDPVAIALVMDAVTDGEALILYNIFNLYMNRTR